MLWSVLNQKASTDTRFKESCGRFATELCSSSGSSGFPRSVMEMALSVRRVNRTASHRSCELSWGSSAATLFVLITSLMRTTAAKGLRSVYLSPFSRQSCTLLLALRVLTLDSTSVTTSKATPWTERSGAFQLKRSRGRSWLPRPWKRRPGSVSATRRSFARQLVRQERPC